MRYAISSKDPACLADAKAAGLDYAEVPVWDFLRPDGTEAEFEDAVARLLAPGLPVESVNCLVCGDYHCTGPAANHDALAAYAATVFRRLAKAGGKIAVFGSGWARAVPDGWPREEADKQFASLLGLLGPLAEAEGIVIAVEPLARVECNFVNTVDEAAAFARASGSPAVGALADSFHWARNGEGPETILAARDRFVHAHVATVPNRKAPGAEPFDWAPFFGALAAIGYDGRVTIECREPAPEGRVEVLARARAAMEEARAAAAR